MATTPHIRFADERRHQLPTIQESSQLVSMLLCCRGFPTCLYMRTWKTRTQQLPGVRLTPATRCPSSAGSLRSELALAFSSNLTEACIYVHPMSFLPYLIFKIQKPPSSIFFHEFDSRSRNPNPAKSHPEKTDRKFPARRAAAAYVNYCSRLFLHLFYTATIRYNFSQPH